MWGAFIAFGNIFSVKPLFWHTKSIWGPCADITLVWANLILKIKSIWELHTLMLHCWRFDNTGCVLQLRHLHKLQNCRFSCQYCIIAHSARPSHLLKMRTAFLPSLNWWKWMNNYGGFFHVFTWMWNDIYLTEDVLYSHAMKTYRSKGITKKTTVLNIHSRAQCLNYVTAAFECPWYVDETLP